MVEIVQIPSCQISYVDCVGGGNSDDWNKKENSLRFPFSAFLERLFLRTPFSLLPLAMS